MANLPTDLRAGLLALLMLPAGLTWQQDARAASDQPEAACAAGNLCFSANGPADYQRDRVVLHDIVVYQGGSPMRVRAQLAEASSLDFNDSTWAFSGAVEVRVAQGRLTADKARVHFLASRLAMASAFGAPATFESDSGISGHAASVDYDLKAGEIRLRGDAWISRDGCNETRAALFVYNLAQKSVHAQGSETAGGSGRVQGTIRQCKPVRPAPGGPAGDKP
ncbi:MAG: LptA/OstA family protein [Steroidobacteraceae bacterium]